MAELIDKGLTRKEKLLAFFMPGIVFSIFYLFSTPQPFTALIISLFIYAIFYLKILYGGRLVSAKQIWKYASLSYLFYFVVFLITVYAIK